VTLRDATAVMVSAASIGQPENFDLPWR